MADHDPVLREPTQHGYVRRLLGTSRLLIALAVLGTFVASATLMVFGLLRTLDIVFRLLGDPGEEPRFSEASGKHLIVEAVSVIDIFLLGTVLYIISAGLYQLFVDDRLPLPRWLHIDTLDDLKAKLTGVIVVGLLVSFLGYVTEWDGTVEIIAVGVAIGAVIFAVGAYYRLTATGAAAPAYQQRVERQGPPDEP